MSDMVTWDLCNGWRSFADIFTEFSDSISESAKLSCKQDAEESDYNKTKIHVTEVTFDSFDQTLCAMQNAQVKSNKYNKSLQISEMEITKTDATFSQVIGMKSRYWATPFQDQLTQNNFCTLIGWRAGTKLRP